MSFRLVIEAPDAPEALALILSRWPPLAGADDEDIDELPWASDPEVIAEGMIEMAVSYGWAEEVVDELTAMAQRYGWRLES